MMTAILQQWAESERGWGGGGARPDGYSLHATVEDKIAFVEAYWDLMPNETPDEYSYPIGDPIPVTVSEFWFNKIKESGKGLYWYGNVEDLQKSVEGTPFDKE